MRKYSLSLITCFLISLVAKAQLENSGATDISPEISNHSVGSEQGGQIYNTDLFTGTTSINIPIYNFSIDELNLGVSLNYGATGVKVDQIASTVGMGWNLNAASYIERVPNDLEDEVYPTATIKGAWSGGLGSNENGSPRNHDLFIANLAGRQIKFAIVLSGDAHLFNCSTCHLRYMIYPNTPIKIQLYNGNNLVSKPLADQVSQVNGVYDYTGFRFVITDEKGNTFNFDLGDYNLKTLKLPDNSLYSYQANCKWWASSITTNRGQTIQYTYENDDHSHLALYRDEKVTEQSYGTISGTYLSKTYNGCYPVDSTTIIEYNGRERRIKKVEYPDGSTVDFTYATIARRDVPSSKTLIGIDVKKGYADLSNKITFSFNQSYMYSGASGFVPLDANYQQNPLRYRLFLNSIDRIVNDNNISAERYYTFTYDENGLPDRLSPSQDYYGYFNNKTPAVPPHYANLTTNVTPVFSIPYHCFSSGDPNNQFNYCYGTDRTPDINYITHGVLKKVKNSMGGEYELYYEAHVLNNPTDFSNYYGTGETLSVNSFDGLRTQKIVYRDGITPTNDKTIQYTYPTDSAYRFYPFFYYWYPTIIISTGTYNGPNWGFPCSYNNYAYFQLVQKKWMNNPVQPIDYYKGFNHGYSKVTETISGASGETISRTEYRYTNILTTSSEPSFTAGFGQNFNSPGKYKICLGGSARKSYMQLTDISLLPESNIGLLLSTKKFVGTSSSPSTLTQYEYELSYPTIPLTDDATNITPRTAFLPNRASNFKVMYDVFQRDYAHDPTVNTWMTVYYPTESDEVKCDLYYPGIFRVKKVTNTNYSTVNTTVTEIDDVKEYEYNNVNNITKIKWDDSKSEHYYKAFVYDDAKPYQYLLSTSICKATGGTDDIVLSYSKVDPISSLPLLFNKFSSLKSSTGVLSSALTTTTDKEYTIRDSKSNIMEIKYKDGLKYASQMWDSRINEKVADVTNARYSDIAYTSFEGFNSTAPFGTYDKGNWSFNEADAHLIGVSPTRSYTITGNYVYKLTAQSNNTIFTSVIGDKDYVLTYWADMPLNVTVNGAAVTSTMVKSSTACHMNLYKVDITHSPFGPPVALAIALKANTYYPNVGYIDELRLYPVGASMVTYTYNPLLGVSSICDGRNNVIYNEYDPKGRLWRTKDIDGSIITQTQTSIQGPNN